MGRYGSPSYQRLCYFWALVAGSGSCIEEGKIAQVYLDGSKVRVQGNVLLDSQRCLLQLHEKLDSHMAVSR